MVLNLENFENNPGCPAMSQSTWHPPWPSGSLRVVGSALDHLRERSASHTSELSARPQTWGLTR